MQNPSYLLLALFGLNLDSWTFRVLFLISNSRRRREWSARMLFLLPLLLLSSPALCQFLDFKECDQDAICLVQKSCVEKGSTEFHTLVAWHGKIEGALTNCVEIRFSKISLRGGQKSFLAQMQIRSEKRIDADFYADFVYGTTRIDTDAILHCTKNEAKGTSKDLKVFVCATPISVPNHLPLFKSRMRIITPTEIFTYNEEDLFDLLESVAIEEQRDPLGDEYVHYCILILVIYVITVYILDLYCRRLQYTTMDREEMEEYFFPPARYIDQLNHFRMMRGPTKIEKETNIGAVPEGILIDYEE